MLIAKSDVVIMVVSLSLLAAGIYRWQNNLSQASETRTAASSSAATQSGNSQRSSSLAAKPETATPGVTRTGGTDMDTPVGNNFGNAGKANAAQAATQNTTVSSGNTATTAGQSSLGNATGQPMYGTYEVTSGDTLSRIAINHGTTVDTLRTINDISGSLITIGQNIRYPLPAN